MSCFQCGAHLGCAVDCPNAPWNSDLLTTNHFGHLRRLVRWVRSVSKSAYITASELKWGDWAYRHEQRALNRVEVSSVQG